jgi:hypothetical protein
MVAIRSDHPRGLIFNVGDVQNIGVVTRLSVDQSVAAQFQPSLNKTIYATPFGDNIGTLTINCILNTPCDETQNQAGKFIENYQKTRFSPDNAQQADLIVGDKAFTGYAVGFTLDASSDNGHTIQGVLKFVAWMTL